MNSNIYNAFDHFMINDVMENHWIEISSIQDMIWMLLVMSLCLDSWFQQKRPLVYDRISGNLLIILWLTVW